jgi:phosphoglycolate phosphatase-like HAD superfamily hydrolase
MNVLLFDIDGTLLYTGGSGMAALRLGFAEVFGRTPPEKISTAGRTDRAIAGDFFRSCEVEDSLENWRRFCEAYLRHLAEQLPLRDGYLFPGVEACLEIMAARDDVVMGLLTGNVFEGARLKLERFGIYNHFQFGGFGEDHKERDGVAMDALAAARDAVDGEFALDRVWVIGDTPNDIRCARSIAANAVAVATGIHAKSDLADASPDLLLDDLRQAEQLLELLV